MEGARREGGRAGVRGSDGEGQGGRAGKKRERDSGRETINTSNNNRDQTK